MSKVERNEGKNQKEKTRKIKSKEKEEHFLERNEGKGEGKEKVSGRKITLSLSFFFSCFYSCLLNWGWRHFATCVISHSPMFVRKKEGKKVREKMNGMRE